MTNTLWTPYSEQGWQGGRRRERKGEGKGEGEGKRKKERGEGEEGEGPPKMLPADTIYCEIEW